jgi:hypothetical protein
MGSSSGKRDSSGAVRGRSSERSSQAVSGGFRTAFAAELGDTSHFALEASIRRA